MACAGNHQLWSSVWCRKIYFHGASFESVAIFFSRANIRSDKNESSLVETIAFLFLVECC